MESIHHDIRTTPVYGLKALALNNISSTSQKITATKYSNRFHPPLQQYLKNCRVLLKIKINIKGNNFIQGSDASSIYICIFIKCTILNPQIMFTICFLVLSTDNKFKRFEGNGFTTGSFRTETILLIKSIFPFSNSFYQGR